MIGQLEQATAKRRMVAYWALGLGLVLAYAVLRGSTWRGGPQLHTILETTATLLALFVGAMALVRYYSRRENITLLVGSGFLGTAFLDGYHALVTSEYFAPMLPSDYPSLVPWSWLAARLFLSLMLCLSWLVWLRDRRGGERGLINPLAVYLGTAVLTLAAFLVLAFVPLPRAFYPETAFHRPAEFLPALLFLAALAGYLRKGEWRRNAAEHYLVLSLILGFVGQAIFLSYSGQLFDMEFVAAHLLKIASYVCVLTGLFISMYTVFRDQEEGAEHFRAVLENIVEGIITIDENGTVRTFNPGAEAVFGYGADETVGRNVSILMPEPDRGRHDRYVGSYLRTGEAKIIGIGREVVGKRKDGEEFPMELAIGGFHAGGQRMFVGVCRDITRRKQFEEEITRARGELEQRVEERTAELSRAQQAASGAHDLLIGAIENISEGFVLYDADERLVLCNDNYREYYPAIADLLVPGTALEDIVRAAVDTGAVQEAVDNESDWRQMRLAQYRSASGSHEQLLPDGRRLLAAERRTPDGHIVGIRTDITELKAREEALHQAQKMEAVGQLTGGVAHDFNNLLTIIRGNLEFLEEAAAGQAEILRLSSPAIRAVERGGALTQRLLAFSRQQPLMPQAIDASELVAGMSELMRRALGEDISIEIVGAGGLWRCQADPSQLENAILNLAINARDAMPGGGKLTIETANVRLDDDYALAQAEVEPGQYVLLAVSDTGSGMPPNVVERAFDPFFTTKDVGMGSGLGLSMIYGFVKQSRGHVKIYSEEGEGTTVKIYFPRAARGADSARDAALSRETPAGQNETVLVVEDDADVRTLVLTMLGSLNYRCVDAGNGKDALARLDDTPNVDLLLTDVVLPGGMGGRELAEEVVRRRPGLRVLYMSGYTENAIIHGGRLDDDIWLLQKPFTKDAMARKIRQVLEAAPYTAPGGSSRSAGK